MNHCVPDFEVDDDYLLPASSSLKRQKKSAMGDEDIMELLWQNGQVVMQSQNQRSVGNKKSETMASTATRSGGIEEETTPCNLFMQEDEMVSWLHYPSDDNSLDLYLHNNDILYPAHPSSAPVTAASSSLSAPPPPLLAAPSPRPPIPPLKRVEEEPSQPKFANFFHFSRPSKGNLTGSAPSNSNKVSPAMTQSTVVESNDRPLQSRASRVTDGGAFVYGGNVGCRGSMSSFGAAGTSSAGREPDTCDVSATSSPGTGGSGASASMEPSPQKPPPATDDRKRKGRDTDDTECYSEEAEFEDHDPKKQSRRSTSTKRTRAAEVHNLSERRRRDRINEKMKALQELIPRCNKSDKASMLDEAIEYLKSLQMQVQMMSMGYSMVPMMFPGVQRYMPPMAAMGMGMGMDQLQLGMNRPMVPYPPVLPGSALPNQSAAHMGPCFPIPRFPIPQAPAMGPARPNPSDPNPNPMMNSFRQQNTNHQQIPFLDPYQQYTGLPQTQLPHPQNQAGMGCVTNKPSSSKEVRPSSSKVSYNHPG